MSIPQERTLQNTQQKNIPPENKQRWDARGREQLETLDMPDVLKNIVRETLNTPQAGAYHNEGLFMASHIGLIAQRIDEICEGRFDFSSIGLPPHLADRAKDFITRALIAQKSEMLDYAYLHDVKKPDCMNIEYIDDDGKKATRIFTLDEWKTMIAQSGGDEQTLQESLKAMRITKIGYRLSEDLTREKEKEHGAEGATYIEQLATQHPEIREYVSKRALIMKGITNHELHFQVFNNAKTAKHYKEKLTEVFSPEEIDFIYAVCFIDIAGSLKEDGTSDFSGFKNMMISRHLYETVQSFARERESIGKPLRENELNALMNLEEQKLMAKIELIRNPPRNPKAEGYRKLKEFGVKHETSALLSKTQAEIEDYRASFNPARRSYGAVPFFEHRNDVIAHFAEEALYFSSSYQPGNEDGAKPPWMDAFYAEGIIMFEMKFGQRLSEFTERILAQYPPIDGEGKEIAVFGLSGSEKSTAVEALRETVGEQAIIMDSDTIRYNLLGKMIADVETAHGATLEEVRSNLMHNNISGALYMAVNHIAKELKKRGYTVIRSAATANTGADTTFYIEHPTVDPETIGTSGEKEKDDAEISETAKKLFDVTQNRVNGLDNFDWENAETILDFRAMRPVTVQVPERVHAFFVTDTKDFLSSHPEVVRVHNPQNENAEEVKENFRAQMANALS